MRWSVYSSPSSLLWKCTKPTAVEALSTSLDEELTLELSFLLFYIAGQAAGGGAGKQQALCVRFCAAALEFHAQPKVYFILCMDKAYCLTVTCVKTCVYVCICVHERGVFLLSFARE